MQRIRRGLVILSLCIASIAGGSSVYAQCPMCKISAESNLQNGGTAGKGLNKGILYMLALPYTLVGTLGFIWWRHHRRREEDEVEVLP